MSDPIEILTGVGRMVQGSCFTPNTTDQQGNPLVIKSGPNAGQAREDYFVGIAVPKTDPMANDTWQKLQAAAQRDWPGGQFNAPNFSWKVIDGDGVDAQGQPYSNRPGFAGCFVFKFNSGFAPKCYMRDANGQLVETTDPNSIKRGFYIRVYGTTKGNGNQTNPGVYLNLSMVELVGYGEEIVSGPDAGAAFGAAAALPQGASATPLAPTTPIAQQQVPGQQMAPAQQQVPGQQMAPAQQQVPGAAGNPPGVPTAGQHQVTPGVVPSAAPTGGAPDVSAVQPSHGFVNPQ